MSKHTPEPWVLSTNDVGGIVIRSNKDTICVFYNYAEQPYLNSQENAARIVACVNACAGIDHPEEVIRAMRAVKVEDLSAEAIGKLKQERDELLSALEEATEYVFYAKRFKFRKIVEKYKLHKTPPQP